MEKMLRTEERHNFYTYTANRRSLKNQNTSGALRKNRKPIIKKYKNRKTDNKWTPYPFSVWNCQGWGGYSLYMSYGDVRTIWVSFLLPKNLYETNRKTATQKAKNQKTQITLPRKRKPQSTSETTRAHKTARKIAKPLRKI